ncbi:hypothetical protein Sjap_010898 [Stephania japonica]|uniref:Uncharacterized protein n=1 Tax=Stephania japonica TaxID=461633 RepID=A0AAP0JCB8_9MAGN
MVLYIVTLWLFMSNPLKFGRAALIMSRIYLLKNPTFFIHHRLAESKLIKITDNLELLNLKQVKTISGHENCSIGCGYCSNIVVKWVLTALVFFAFLGLHVLIVFAEFCSRFLSTRNPVIVKLKWGMEYKSSPSISLKSSYFIENSSLYFIYHHLTIVHVAYRFSSVSGFLHEPAACQY